MMVQSDWIPGYRVLKLHCQDTDTWWPAVEFHYDFQTAYRRAQQLELERAIPFYVESPDGSLCYGFSGKAPFAGTGKRKRKSI